MKVLVTGANGFLGSWVTKALIKKGYDVRMLHRSESDLTSLEGLKIEKFIGDITDFESLKSATQNVEAVFHVAGLVSYSHLDRTKMETVNVAGTANVIKACQMTKVRRLIHTSSTVAIGAGFHGEILDEKSKYNLRALDLGYFETKHNAEQLVLSAARAGSLDAVVVNPSSMFGAGDAVKSSRLKYLKVARGQLPYYPSGGVNIIAIEDAVEGHILALEKGKSGERYILGGENISVLELFETFAKAGGSVPPTKKLPKALLRGVFYSGKLMAKCGLPVKFSFESAMIGSLYHWFDNSKAKNELGLKVSSPKEAIIRSVEWAESNGMI